MKIREESPKSNARRVQSIFPCRTLLLRLRSAASHFTRPCVLSEFHVEWLHEHDGGSSRLQYGLDRRDTSGGYPAVVSDQDHGALLAVYSAVSIHFSPFPFSTPRAFLSRAAQFSRDRGSGSENEAASTANETCRGICGALSFVDR